MQVMASDEASPALVAIAAPGGLQAEINPFGAELWRLRDGEGQDLLWDGDPAFWTGRAPVLFPVIGCLRDDSYRYRGASYQMPKHGFARRSVWDLADHQADRATFRLAASAATRTGYPFEFVLDLTFTVGPDALSMAAEITNAGDEVMPFSFGFHPALRWPVPGGAARDDCRLRFDRDEDGDIARLDGDGLIARTEPSPVDGCELALRDDLFTEDALIFRGLRSRGLDYGGVDGRQLRIDFPGFPDLGVWTNPGAGYVCIEPWLGYADPADFAGEIFAKPGICTLQPGHSWQAAMTIAPAETP